MFKSLNLKFNYNFIKRLAFKSKPLFLRLIKILIFKKMKNLKIIILLIPFIFFGQEKSNLDYLYPKKDLIIKYHDDWGKNNYNLKILEFKKQPLNYGDIVFLGNSITAGGKNWSKRLNYPNIKNRGIEGDVTDGVLARIDEIVHFKPKAIFLLIGINDLWNFSPNNPPVQYIGNNIIKITQIIKDKSSKTEIYVQTVLPVKKEIYKESIKRLNNIIKLNQDENLYKIIDLYSLFTDDKGLMRDDMSNDGIHLNEKGYDTWAQIIKPILSPVE